MPWFGAWADHKTGKGGAAMGNVTRGSHSPESVRLPREKMCVCTGIPEQPQLQCVEQRASDFATFSSENKKEVVC